jgi:hypothetical protein
MSVTTLLYTGGTILSSKKSGYKDDSEKAIRELMQNQHKQMLIDLKDGVYDDPEQTKMEEPEEVTKKDETTILDAIKAIEEKMLEEILAKGESGATDDNKEPEKDFDKLILSCLSEEDAKEKGEKPEE